MAYIPAVDEQERIAAEFDQLETSLSRLVERFEQSLKIKATLLNSTVGSNADV